MGDLGQIVPMVRTVCTTAESMFNFDYVGVGFAATGPDRRVSAPFGYRLQPCRP